GSGPRRDDHRVRRASRRRHDGGGGDPQGDRRQNRGRPARTAGVKRNSSFRGRILAPPPAVPTPSPHGGGVGRGPGRGEINENIRPPLPSPLLPRREEREKTMPLRWLCQDAPSFRLLSEKSLPHRDYVATV